MIYSEAKKTFCGKSERRQELDIRGRVRVASFSISLDGLGAGARQDLQNPLGGRGTEIFAWFSQTEVWNKVRAQGGGSRGVDNEMNAKAFGKVGAWILGRNMFGPVRGPWADDSWKGWWARSLRIMYRCLC